MIVVDDIDSIPPKNSALTVEKPIKWPMPYPAHIMPVTIISAVTTAEPPVLTSFLKLNSSPSEKSKDNDTNLGPEVNVGLGGYRRQILKWGLARKPATM